MEPKAEVGTVQSPERSCEAARVRHRKREKVLGLG